MVCVYLQSCIPQLSYSQGRSKHITSVQRRCPASYFSNSIVIVQFYCNLTALSPCRHTEMSWLGAPQTGEAPDGLEKCWCGSVVFNDTEGTQMCWVIIGPPWLISLRWRAHWVLKTSQRTARRAGQSYVTAFKGWPSIQASRLTTTMMSIGKQDRKKTDLHGSAVCDKHLVFCCHFVAFVYIFLSLFQ